MNKEPKIKILSPEIYNRIAAGEVVERPANVVKELVENSIDAAASEIVIEIFSAGKKLIRITDNGIGMSKEDLLLAVQPHATSKISKFEDIHNLSTLGFRGEALSSITSVSKTRIVSKQKDSDTGNEIVIHGSKIISETKCAANNGTSVEIKDLFYNTPARFKFLKSDYTEKIHIIRTIEEYCIANKNILFKLFVDGNLVFSVSPTEHLKKRLEDILGKDVIKGLIHFEHRESDKLTFYGFVSQLDSTQVNKSLQMFFINNRPVNSRMVSQALYDAYRDSLPTGRHPAGIILITIDPSEIDVNVHPTKRMVKFKSDNTIYELLKKVIRSQFKKVVSIETGFMVDPQQTESKIKPKYEQLQNVSPPQITELIFSSETKSVTPSFIPVATNSVSTIVTEKKEKISSDYENIGFKDFVYLGQLHKTYLLLETIKGITIIDQHAASERVLYEKFVNTKILPMQRLLLPINIELKISELETIKPYIDIINNLGFEMSLTGKNSVGITGIPAIFKIGDVKDFITRFVENLISEFTSTTNQTITSKERIARSACRAAIKANDILTLKDVEELISDLSKSEQPFTCPHGRPTILNITIPELEKMFLRRK